MNIIDLGLKDYSEVWDFQKECVSKRAENKIPDTLILVEHPHVITKGRRGKEEDILTADIPVYEIERGGEVTYHGPGQLVGYPIVNLIERKLGVKKHMRILEDVLIQTLEHFDICAERKEGSTGVWVKDRKIASLGVAVKRWVTYHGWALNVNTDLSYFQKIHPCGFDCSVMTSMQSLRGKLISMDEVKSEVIRIFGGFLGN